jgi:hypothetical protein
LAFDYDNDKDNDRNQVMLPFPFSSSTINLEKKIPGPIHHRSEDSVFIHMIRGKPHSAQLASTISRQVF